jgi:hypothetical protein
MRLIYDGVKPGRKEGNQRIFRQGNEGLSVVCQPGSFGYEQGLFEICKVKFHGDSSYDFDLNGDPLGYLTNEEVLTIVEWETKEDE